MYLYIFQKAYFYFQSKFSKTNSCKMWLVEVSFTIIYVLSSFLKFNCDLMCFSASEASNYTETTCLVEDQTVREGERFYPRNTCVRCVCPQNFTGKLEEPYCQRISCNVQIRDSENLEKSCAPFYFKSSDETDATLCCPSDWICRKYTCTRCGY